MGMFDKDKEIGLILQNWIPLGTPFIVWDARIIREDFPTDLGLAIQSGLVVSAVDSPQDRYDVTTLASAIASKVRDAERGDFPAVVQLIEVPSKWGRNATVLQFLKPYDGPGAKQYGKAAPSPTPATSDVTPPAGDDISF